MEQVRLRIPVIVTCIEEGCFFAEIPIIRGSTKGETKEEALDRIKDVVRLSLAHAAEECDTISTKYTIEQIDVTVSRTGARMSSHTAEKRLADWRECWYNEHCQ